MTEYIGSVQYYRDHEAEIVRYFDDNALNMPNSVVVALLIRRDYCRDKIKEAEAVGKTLARSNG